MMRDAAIDNWKAQHPDFLCSPKGRQGRIRCPRRALYQRANGYSYETVKIFCDKNGKVTRVPYRVHVPPDVTAQIFWLKNRDPEHWRDAWQVEHQLGKYVLSETPMTEAQWIAERATMIDVSPQPAKPRDEGS